MNLHFTNESCDTLKSFSLFLAVKNIPELNMEHSVKLEIEFRKISRRHSRSPVNAKSFHVVVLQRTLAEDVLSALLSSIGN